MILNNSGPLHFLGSGNGGSTSHTNAYFIRTYDGKVDVFFIDLSLLNAPKAYEIIKSMPVRNVFLLITHMHIDHVSGLGWFSVKTHDMGITLNVIAHPNIRQDIKQYLAITGERDNYYRLCTVYDTIQRVQYSLPFDNHQQERDVTLSLLSSVNAVISTDHDPELFGKCFGYRCTSDSASFVYTGDTSTLENYLPYIQDGDTLYVEARTDRGEQHLCWFDIQNILLELSKNHAIWLMHYDKYDDMKAFTKDIPNIDVVRPEE